MTKAEEKIKNITEAMGVFEKWLEENGGGASNKNATTDNSDKVETVKGLGFKDKKAAEETLRILDGRDPDYQKLAIKGLIGGSKRVLGGTKNEDKIKDIKAGVKTLEDFLEKFDNENLSKNNMAYLTYDIISSFPKPEDELLAEFVETYGKTAKGNYKHLRTLFPKDDDSKSWDIIRNKKLKNIRDKIKEKDLSLFRENGEPTEEHLKMIYWAYTPQKDKVKSYLEKKDKKSEKRKTSSDEDATPSKKKKSE